MSATKDIPDRLHDATLVRFVCDWDKESATIVFRLHDWSFEIVLSDVKFMSIPVKQPLGQSKSVSEASVSDGVFRLEMQSGDLIEAGHGGREVRTVASLDLGTTEKPLRALAPDVPAMLDQIWNSHGHDEANLVARLHAYYVACGRAIFDLLPHKDSRRSVELAERYLAGKESFETLLSFDWYSEAAAFTFDFNVDSDEVQRWIGEVALIPEKRLRQLHRDIPGYPALTPLEILRNAAYFANDCLLYSGAHNHRAVSSSAVPFLSVDLLLSEFGSST